jgi:hypothetical protein
MPLFFCMGPECCAASVVAGSGIAAVRIHLKPTGIAHVVIVKQAAVDTAFDFHFRSVHHHTTFPKLLSASHPQI